jgi:hypothetical protein
VKKVDWLWSEKGFVFQFPTCSTARLPLLKKTAMWFYSRGCVASRLLAALLLTSAAGLAWASAALPPHIVKYINDAKLAGTGRLSWFGLHVYNADLYAPRGFDVAQPYALPFVLELTYARELKGSAIADASRDEIERLGIGSPKMRSKWHSLMTRLFPNVIRGQKLAGVFQPGAGARFYFDGRFIGAIEDPAFAPAFFAIWLDERTRAPRLREALLKADPRG